jgi:hypothetical protein
MRLPLAAALMLALAGCERGAPGAPEGAAPAVPVGPTVPPPADRAPAVSVLAPFTLEIGRRVDGDGRVLGETRAFRRGDSVFVSLLSEGASPASLLRVRWQDAAGTVLHADERAVSTTGPAVHTFRLTPGDAWPAGRYRVEIDADGQRVGSREFDWP